MNNANLLADLFLAAAALATPAAAVLTTPFSHSAPAAKARGLTKFLVPHREAPHRTKVAARHTTTARKMAARALTYTVTATAYQAVPGQTDDEPFVTADNSFIKPHYGSKERWMALSRDLLKPWGGPFKFGDKVRVRGLSARLDGVYTIHDTMNRRHRHCMDVLVHPSEKFDLLCKGVKIQKVAPL